MDVDDHGDYKTFWHCDAPSDGEQFQVIRQEWMNDFTERHVYEIRIASGGSSSH